VTVQVWSSRAAGPDAARAAAVRGSGAALVVAIGAAVSEAAAEADGELSGAAVGLGDAGEPDAHPVTRSATPAAILTVRGMPQQ
jgi:hypothetical protein